MDAIFRRLRPARIVQPPYRFGDPDARYYRFTMPRRLLMLASVKRGRAAGLQRLLIRDNLTRRRSDPAGAQAALRWRPLGGDGLVNSIAASRGRRG